MFGIEKPLPMANEETEPYWDACRRERLVACRCAGCAHWFLPPARICPSCLSDRVSLEQTSGRGRLYSFIVVHRPQHPAFAEDAPYNVAIVELNEGPRMHTRIVGAEPASFRIGMELEVTFEKVDDEVTLPLFRPRAAPQS